jgi:peptidoglycan hydrolase-like protein with peptidoglycan-binding domain
MARVRSALLAAGVAAAVLATAVPAYAAAPPTSVTGLAAAPASGQVTLTWTNPADPDFAGVTVVWKNGATPATAADGTAREVASGATTTVTGLANGTTYGFSVFTRNTDGDLSAPASVTAVPVPPVPTTLTAAAGPVTLAYNHKTVIKGTLTRTDNGDALSGKTVEVWRKMSGEDAYRRVYRVTTSSAGVAAYPTLNQLTNTHWYLKFAGDPLWAASQGATLAALVAPRITWSLSAKEVEQNVAVTLHGTVAPAHPGRTIALQRYFDGAWHGVTSAALSSTSKVAFSIRKSTVGARYYRMVTSAHGDHTTGKTTVIGIKWLPRTLRPGMSGSDVLTAQRRLAALHYDTGALNGYYGYDTQHATMAFQKVNGLTVSGNVDATTRTKLAHPVLPKFRHARATGTWVEVDLTKQVLLYGRDGKLVRVLDISSGSGKLFTVDGETQRATTPTGSFHVFHKIDGARVSRLGTLWRPAYFASGGYAIHGSSFVPAWPDSHGCVRITNSAMNRLFSMLTIGMPVFVYRS